MLLMLLSDYTIVVVIEGTVLIKGHFDMLCF